MLGTVSQFRGTSPSFLAGGVSLLFVPTVLEPALGLSYRWILRDETMTRPAK